MTAEKILAVINVNLAQATARSSSHYVVIGFHQETAAKYLPRIRAALSAVAPLNARGRVVDFIGMPYDPPALAGW